jgi:hypothetical protein
MTLPRSGGPADIQGGGKGGGGFHFFYYIIDYQYQNFSRPLSLETTPFRFYGLKWVKVNIKLMRYYDEALRRSNPEAT